MKKAARTTIIVLIAMMTLAIATVTASAATTSKVTKVDIKKASTSLNVGKSEGLAISYSYIGAKPSTSGMKWSSTNSNIAKVTNGTVIAKKAGTANVKVNFGGKTDTCKVTVKATPDKWINVSAAYTELNKYRKAAKLAGLKRDATLENIAKIRAKEMALTGKFSHTRPNGQSSLTLIKGNKHKGENIAKGQTTCAQVTKAWYNSKGHRDNMLRKTFTKVGIACYEHNGVTYWAQVFSSN